MNSFIKYIPESLNDHKAFVEHMLSIIDTKLQFTKHRTNALIASYNTSTVLEGANDTAFLENFTFDLGIAPSEDEQIFILIEKYSKTTSLLLLLRNKLKENNVSLIYDLLNNDRYLSYESEDLEKLLENNQ